MKLLSKPLLFLILLLPLGSLSQWNEITNHPFTDTLWSVFKDGNKSLVTGNEGVLHSPDWFGTITEISDFDTQLDSDIYHRSIFYKCYIDDFFHLWVFGRDTVTNQGVAFYSYDNEEWSCKLSSSLTEKFVDYVRDGNDIVAVGGNAFARFSLNGYFELEGNIGPIGEDYFAIENASSGDAMALSYNHMSLMDIGTGNAQDFTISTGYKDLQILGINPLTYGLIRDDKLFKSEEPFFHFQKYNRIYERDTFTCMENNNSGIFIGSEKGVYKYTYNTQIGEKSVGSESYYITGLWAPTNMSDEVYAVGPHGKIITTTDADASTFPFVAYDYNQTYCLDSSNVIENLGKNSYSYDWYIDNVHIASTYDLNYTFTTPGQFELKLVGSNGTFSDSLTRMVSVVPPPSPTIDHSVSTNLICHEGTVDFTFETEPGMTYGLKRKGVNYPDYIFTGNGGSMTVTSDLITDTTVFELHAGYPSESCFVLHELDTIYTQHPKAKFYTRLINAEEGEDIGLFEQSEFADTVEWLLTQNQPVFISDNHFETNYTNTYGQKTIGMIAHTYEGCSDTLIREDEVFIIDTMEYTDVCFSLLFQEEDFYAGYNTPLYFDLESDSLGNFYVAGAGNVNIPSTIGISIDSVTSSGYFLAKYNKYGVLKWIHTATLGAYVADIRNLEIREDGSFELDMVCKLSTPPMIFSTDGKVYDLSLVPDFQNSSVNSLSILISNTGALKKVFSADVNTIIGIDDAENFYYSNFEYNPAEVIYFDPDTTYSYNSYGGSFGKFSENGHHWSMFREFKNLGWTVDRESQKIWVKDSVIQIIGQDFDYAEELESTDNFVYENTYSNGIGVLVQYDTTGKYRWHYLLKGVDHNTKVSQAIDQNLNSYYGFWRIDTPTLELIDASHDTIEANHHLISFDVDGNVRYDLQFGGISEFYYRNLELEIKEDKLEFVIWFRSYNGDSIYIPSAQNGHLAVATSMPFTGAYNECLLYMVYDTSGNLLNYELYEDEANGFFYDDMVVPENSTIDNNGNLFFESNISQGAIWNNTYYPKQVNVNGYYDSGQHLIVNSLTDECADGTLLLQQIDSICYIDSINIDLSSNFTPYNTFLSNNHFIVHSSDTSFFENGSIGDTIGATDINNLSWSFDFSVDQPDTLWIRVESTHPYLYSNMIAITFIQPQNNTFDTLRVCSGDTVELVAQDGVSYLWIDELQNQIGANDSINVVITDSSTYFEVEVTNVCSQSWTNGYEFIPNEYNAFNTDSIHLCLNVSDTVEFLPEYQYSMNGYTSQIDSLTYMFEFGNDTTIYYSVQDSLSCIYNDSIQFLVHTTPSPNLSNTDSIDLCPNISDTVLFLSEFEYSMNGYTSQIDSLTYVFEFGNDTTIYYSLQDSLSCIFNDSVHFFIHPTQSPNLALIGPPWEITVTNVFDIYDWYSSAQFDPGSGVNSIIPLEDGEYFVEVTDFNGCITTDSIFFSDASVMEMSGANILIYPNPTYESLNISGDNGMFDRVEIISMEGRVVYSSIFSSTISTENLMPGSYFIRLSNNSNSIRYRFVKR